MEHTSHHRWHMAHVTPTATYAAQLPENASPYLLPQWALFWERAWGKSDTECWQRADDDRSPTVIGVRRYRAIWNWLHCLPYGTTGIIGVDAQAAEELVDAIADKRTVQISLGGVSVQSEIPGWQVTVLDTHAFVLDVRSETSSSPLEHASEHHQRNIEKGKSADAEIKLVNTADDVHHLQSSWRGSGATRSRIVLDPRRGPLLAEVFVGNDALAWYVLWHDSHPVATCLWLTLGTQAVYVDGAVDRTAPAGLNHRLFAHVLTSLHAKGVRCFDFGSGPLGQSSEGLTRFKEGWGAVPQTRYETVLRRPRYAALRRMIR